MRIGIALTAALLPPAYWFAAAEERSGTHCRKFAPALAAYAAAKRPGERIFNDPTVGSCALAHEPDQKVFIDTRFDFYGAEFTEGTLIALYLRPGWERVLEEWGIEVAILSKRWPLAQALAASGAFVTLFEDAHAVVLRRVVSDNAHPGAR